MTEQAILTKPNEILRQLSEPVEAPDEMLVDQMVSAALAWEEATPGQLCAAMSAIQLGVAKQVMIVRTTRSKPSFFEAYYNPHVVDYSAAQVSAPEGCMSVPATYEYTLRAEGVVVEVCDKWLNKKTIEASGHFARMWQHETDHMVGKIFNDSRPKRGRYGN